MLLAGTLNIFESKEIAGTDQYSVTVRWVGSAGRETADRKVRHADKWQALCKRCNTAYERFTARPKEAFHITSTKYQTAADHSMAIRVASSVS
jgi:hypothetical protein